MYTRRNWDSPNPLPLASVPSPPDQGGGEHTRLRLRGWGSPNSDYLEKKLSTLPTLWDIYDAKRKRFTNIQSRNISLKGQCHEIFCFWFSLWISFPQPRSIPLGPFQIFSNIRGDIRKSRCTTGINDNGGKFCHQFPLCCWHRWQKEAELIWAQAQLEKAPLRVCTWQSQAERVRVHAGWRHRQQC
jgi:hypothetical protein